MSLVIIVRSPGGSWTASAGDFPLALGGPDTRIPLPGLETAEPVAYLGLEEGALFIQPTGHHEPVHCNGTPISTSRWLHPGDSIDVGGGRISVTSEGDATALAVSGRAPADPSEPPGGPVQSRNDDTQATITPIAFSPAIGAPRRSPGWRPHPLSVGLVVFSALAAAVLWYVLTARAVTIEISPRPDTVGLDGGLIRPGFAGRFLLRPGDYRLTAEHPNFRRLETELTVTAESGQVFRFNLSPLPGTLSVTTDPLVGATVEIDGRPAGQTPLAGFELELGVHEVVVRADRHQVYSSEVSINEPGGRHELSVELVPAWAAVTIRSEPSGAEIGVDGTVLGTTPLTSDIGAGNHRLVLRLRGFKTYQSALDVVAEQPQTLPVTRLEPADAVLAVTSNPAGATVTVDGDFAGQTPLRLPLEPALDHVIKISKAGHRTHAATVRLEAATSDRLAVTLEPLWGEVQILSTPADAEILVDGEPRGRTPETLRLTAISHTVELRKESFTPNKITILPENGLLETVRLTLQPVDDRPAEPAAFMTTSQGVRLERIPAGRVLMGASRREPGRRANESIREVEITTPFYLAVHEVTNDQFHQFSPGHSSGQAGGMSLQTGTHPVVGVTWEAAIGYCNWLSEREGLPPVYMERDGRWTARAPLPDGYRLPTEAEWALAARMAGGGEPRKYPWGDDLPLPTGAGNYGDVSASRILGSNLPAYNDGFPITAPVGSFEANPLGIFDLGGNVTEWIHDAYTIYPQGSGEIARDPVGPAEGEYHVIRGASWMATKLTRLRLSYRGYGDEPAPDLGFRIARNAR